MIVRAAVYARYSSENQRPESIDDQISSCRKMGVARGYVLLEEHIYTDQAASGARQDREGLANLLSASDTQQFEVVLVDDLSRLARDNYLMLTILAQLRFNGVRVVSVADGLDSEDEEAVVGIQVRGIFNELQLRDLRKKTLRGQIGQKERGFCVGERTFGYKSVPVGTLRMDKKGRPRPDGYKMVIEPSEAAIVLRVFGDFADGSALTRIVRDLNSDKVPGRFKNTRGWSPATITRMLRNEKYTGRWVWNRTESRRDPKTGRRRKFAKPESSWIVQEDDSLRIVPQKLWEAVLQRLEETKKTWPGQKGKRGFEIQHGGWTSQYPSHLLAGSMICGRCGKMIAQVSGKSGGYYGCLSATKAACDNRLLVKRTLVERMILSVFRDRILSAENLEYVLTRVEQELDRTMADVPETLRLKQAELTREERKIGNFVEFIGEGRGSRALAEALAAAEQRADHLRGEIEALEHTRTNVFKKPPRCWIEERLTRLQELLEKKTTRSALLLRKVIGPIRLEPTRGDIGRPYYRAHSNLDVLALLDAGSELGDPEPGSNPLRKWGGGN